MSNTNLSYIKSRPGMTDQKQDSILKSIQGSRVLLVVNDPSHRKLMIKMLKQAKIVYLMAADAGQAVAIAVKAGFEAVLMDVDLPQIDGYAAAEIIRSVLPDFNVPIIAILGPATGQDRQKCFRSGMNDYIRKPVSQEALLTTLALWAGKGLSLK